MEPARRIYVGALAATAVFAAVSLAWHRAGWGGPEATLWFANGISIIGPVVGGVWCLVRAARETGRAQDGWRLIAASLWAWALGMVAWSYNELWALRDLPIADREVFPYWSDLGFLAFFPLAAMGILWLAKGIFRSAARRLILLRAGVLGISVLIAAWTLVVRDTVDAFEDRWELLVALLYPIGDIILATVTLWAATFTPPQDRRPLGWILFAVALLVIADTLFARAVGADAWQIPWYNVLWPVAFLLIGCAALRPPDARTWTTPDPIPMETLPWICAALAVVAVIIDRFVRFNTGIITLLLSAVLVVLVFGLAMATFRERAPRELAP